MGREDKFVPEEPAPRVEVKQQVVIDKATGKVKRLGYCDFASDGSHKPQQEAILIEGRDFDGTFHGDVLEKDYHWSVADQDFVESEKPAARPTGPVLVSPDGVRWELVINNGGTLSAVKL